MKIRLLAEARGAYRKAFLDAMLEFGDDIELTLHFGDKNSDFDVVSLMRQEGKNMPGGRLPGVNMIDKAAINLIQNPDYEKNLTRFIDHLNRNSKRYVGRSHRMYQLHEYVDYYHILNSAIAEKMIEKKITHVLFFDIPHLAIDTVIYDVARFLKLEIVILCQLYPDKVFSCSKIEDFGRFEYKDVKRPHFDHTAKDNDLWYMAPEWQNETKYGNLNWKIVLQFYFYLIRYKPYLIFNIALQGKVLKSLAATVSRLPYWRTQFDKFFDFDRLNYLTELADLEQTNPDLSLPYIYFPLHLQPEMTTSSLGGRFRDQLIAIEQLSAKLPLGWRILVKENPKQGAFSRSPLFFFRFKRIPNISLVKSDMNTMELIKKSKLVATVTGSAAMEAAEHGIPAIIFGAHWFRSVHGIFEYHDEIDLEILAKQDLDTSLTKAQKHILLSSAHRVNIDKGFFPHAQNFDHNNNTKNVGKLAYRLIVGIDELTFNSKHECE